MNIFCKFDPVGFLYYIMLVARRTTVFSTVNAIMLQYYDIIKTAMLS